MAGRAQPPQFAALLIALALMGARPAVVVGLARTMRARATRLSREYADVFDTCGTGGDRAHTFNVSTVAALVVAACGVKVAKHGNRSVSSRSGSADVLAALGVPVDVPPEVSARALDEVGIAFLFAPLYHPAMRAVMGVRRELGMRTIFNVLGPLTNPAGARRQLMGVYAPELVETIARVQADLGSEHALVVHGSDGLDEITTTGPTAVAEVRDGRLEVYTVEPERLGLRRATLAELAGGEPAENAEAMRRVLGGEPGPLADVTAANAGAALYVGGAAPDLASGVELARGLLEAGAAAAKLEALVAFCAAATAEGPGEAAPR
jgi:anthranilate phosphoribosyltransferase